MEINYQLDWHSESHKGPGFDGTKYLWDNRSLNWGLVHRLFMSSQSLDPLPHLYSYVNVTLLRQVY